MKMFLKGYWEKYAEIDCKDHIKQSIRVLMIINSSDQLLSLLWLVPFYWEDRDLLESLHFVISKSGFKPRVALPDHSIDSGCSQPPLYYPIYIPYGIFHNLNILCIGLLYCVCSLLDCKLHEGRANMWPLLASQILIGVWCIVGAQ